MLVNVLVSPVINRIMHTNNELATHVILDPYIISYVLAGFLWGQERCHILSSSAKCIGGGRSLYWIIFSHHIRSYHVGCGGGRAYK